MAVIQCNVWRYCHTCLADPSKTSQVNHYAWPCSSLLDSGTANSVLPNRLQLSNVYLWSAMCPHKIGSIQRTPATSCHIGWEQCEFRAKVGSLFTILLAPYLHTLRSEIYSLLAILSSDDQHRKVKFMIKYFQAMMLLFFRPKFRRFCKQGALDRASLVPTQPIIVRCFSRSLAAPRREVALVSSSDWANIFAGVP